MNHQQFESLFNESLSLILSNSPPIDILDKINKIISFSSLADANHKDSLLNGPFKQFLLKESLNDSMEISCLSNHLLKQLDNLSTSSRLFHFSDGHDYKIRELSFKQATYGWQTWSSCLILSSLLISNSITTSNLNVMELGSGTGLIGCILANLNPKMVLLTDHQLSIIENINYNLLENNCMKENIKVELLDWNDLNGNDMKYDLILGSDLVYEYNQAQSLPLALSKLISSTSKAHIILPNRIGFENILQEFIQSLSECGLMWKERLIKKDDVELKLGFEGPDQEFIHFIIWSE